MTAVRILELTLYIYFGLQLIACAKPPQNQQLNSEKQSQTSENAVNINLASAQELEKLPHIGAGTAKKIIEFRERNGKFRRPEYLILVPGMTDKKFREIQNLVKVE